MPIKIEQQHLRTQDYEFLTTLGSGAYGQVKLVLHRQNRKYCCVKIMKKSELIESQQVDHVQNEMKILSAITHPFVVQFNGIAQDNKLLYFFLQYVAGGQLFTHLRKEGSFPAAKSAFYAGQITTIFEYLHGKDIVYRDLKPQNILLAPDGYLKLTDFGFAKHIDCRTYTICGTPEYLAPEILENKGHGKPVDWWTLGVLIYEMLAGIDPFADQDPMSIYQNILCGKVHFPKSFDSDAKSLVRHLLCKDLSKRYGNLKNGSRDIKEHRFLASIDFSRLLAKKISPPYRPIVKDFSDTSNFSGQEESGFEGKDVKASEDPFLSW